MNEGIDLLIGYKQENIVKGVLLRIDIVPCSNLFDSFFYISQEVVPKFGFFDF